MRTTALISLMAATFLAGCPSKKTTATPSDGVEEEGMSGKSKIDAAGLVVKLEATAGSFAADAPVTVKMTVANPTDSARTFCDYHTPFEGIFNDIFAVTDADGSLLAYRGKMAKRAPPGRDDYIKLKPGASRDAEVDLRDGYDLTSGTYTVKYKATGISGLGDSNEVTIEITE